MKDIEGLASLAGREVPLVEFNGLIVDGRCERPRIAHDLRRAVAQRFEYHVGAQTVTIEID
jgi:hypothetical protein